jgi:cystathionine beta-lyase/cystathionine gamma-synthase
MRAYAEGRLGDVADADAGAHIALQSVRRIIAIGSDRMMAAVAAARHGILASYLDPAHRAIGSINSPMQCMMKEVCAQCLQPHRDPVTGKVSYVFSCFNQDQPLDHVEFASLRSRLGQNGAQEKLTKLWVDHCLRTIGVRGELVETT